MNSGGGRLTYCLPNCFDLRATMCGTACAIEEMAEMVELIRNALDALSLTINAIAGAFPPEAEQQVRLSLIFGPLVLACLCAADWDRQWAKSFLRLRPDARLAYHAEIVLRLTERQNERRARSDYSHAAARSGVNMHRGGVWPSEPRSAIRLSKAGWVEPIKPAQGPRDWSPPSA
ncbi:hypothetical protein GCM10027426_06420 [Microbacterium lacusdiani]